MKITKATPEEKAGYKLRDPNNPNTLHGWVGVKDHTGNVQRCAVEYLGEGDVNWEVLAPKGYQFERGCHSYLERCAREYHPKLSVLPGQGSMKDTLVGQFRALAERYKIDVLLGRAKPVEPVELPFKLWHSQEDTLDKLPKAVVVKARR